MTLEDALVYAMKHNVKIEFYTNDLHDDTMFIKAIKNCATSGSMISFKEIEQKSPVTIADLVVDVVDNV